MSQVRLYALYSDDEASADALAPASFEPAPAPFEPPPAPFEPAPAPFEPAPGATGLHDAFDHVPAGVYSALRTYERARFLRLDLHMARTHRSALASGWPDFDEGRLRRGLDQVVRQSKLETARVRFDVLAEPLALAGGPSRLLIGIEPLTPVPEQLLREGVRAGLLRELKRERPLVKSTDFVRRRRPYERRARHLYEQVMLDEGGRLLEGVTSNFFGLLAGTLRSAGEGVLEGVTRAILLELARELELPVVLEPLHVEELPLLDEAFITSSARGLVPVIAVDELSIGAGRPGPVSVRLLEAYARYAEREARPAVPWSA